MRMVIFINAHSRRGRKFAGHVRKQFLNNQAGLNVIEIIVVRRLKNLDTYLSRLKAVKKLDCVVIGSGDGTIVAVLNALKNRKHIRYGFLPLGTSNTFVRSIGLSTDVDKAITAVLGGKTRKVSLGTVNGTIFANIAGIGLPVRVARNLSNRTKRYLGSFAYLAAGAKELVSHTSMRCRIVTDKSRDDFYTHHLLIANGKYHGHLPVAANASLYKNKLLVIAFGVNESRWQYLKSMLRFSLSTHEQDANVRIMPCTKATITTKPRRSIEADGEIIGKTPAKIIVKKNAIRVFVPSSS